MNSVGAADHLLVIFRTTAVGGFLFALNRLPYGVLLAAYLRLNSPQIVANRLAPRLLEWFAPVSKRGVVFPKGLGGFNGFVSGSTIFSILTVCWGS